MIDTVLKEIREAEAEADKLQKDAYAKGRELVLNAEAEAERQKKITVLECKEDRKKAALEARRRADEKAQIVLKKGAENAIRLIDQKNSAVEDAANKVMGILFERYSLEPGCED